jgi:hypothetical protein
VVVLTFAELRVLVDNVEVTPLGLRPTGDHVHDTH